MIISNLVNGDMSLQDIWGAYQDGIDYNALIELPETVEENNYMYIGRQWEGIETEGLPTSVLDIIKPTVQFKVANIMSSQTKIVTKPIGLAGKPNDHQVQVSKIVNDQLDKICERIDLNSILSTLMTRTAVDGDGAWNVFWNEDIQTGESVNGDIDVENISNVHIYFGNVTEPDPQKQPYIIVERREYISLLKSYAKAIGLGEDEIDTIQPDTENQFTIINDDNRVTVLTFYYRDYETKTIKMIECTQNLILQEQDTGLKLYPVCWQNWEPRLNDYHGESLVSEMVTNQITINKMASMQAISLSRTAFPTILYNSSLIPDGWDNSVGAAIGIENLWDVNAKDVATTIDPANHSSQLDKFIEFMLNTTKDLNGINDTVLGSINPENTSAIIAVQKSSTVPLKLNEIREHKFLQDFARIAIDFMANYYGERSVLMFNKESGENEVRLFNFDELQNVALNIKIEVGASSYWSEIGETQTLENLLDRQIIDNKLFVELLPVGNLSEKNKVLEYIIRQERAQLMADTQDGIGSVIEKTLELAGRAEKLRQANPRAYEKVIQKVSNKIMG